MHWKLGSTSTYHKIWLFSLKALQLDNWIRHIHNNPSRNKQESSKFMNITLHSRTIPPPPQKKKKKKNHIQIDRILANKIFYSEILRYLHSRSWSVPYYSFFESVNCRKSWIVLTIIFVLCNENFNTFLTRLWKQFKGGN